MTSNRQRSFSKRLFLKIREVKGSPERIRQLRGNVYLLTFKHNPPLILKGFSSYEKWHRQQMVTSLIKQAGFEQTYQMYKEPHPFELEGLWYGFIECLPTSRKAFSFANREDRIEGANLLEAFHNHADSLSISLPSFNQLRKWQDRFVLFLKHAPLISEHISASIVKEWITWGEWSLKGMAAHQGDLHKEKKTIIHGDCAHHNFLRKQDGTLTLIDFDLIAKAPRLYDYLQYANRILPHLEHPDTEIWDYSQIKAYQENPAFLYALAYPSDIFREWNLLFRTKFHLDHVWKITVSDFEKRMDVNKMLAQLVSS